MAYPTAGQVQSAYTTDLSPLIAGIQNIGEVAAQNRALQERRFKEQRAQQVQGLGLISDAVDPLSKGTGFSPFDDLNTTHLGAVKQRATQMVMAGADPASTYLYLQNATNGIRARQADALKGIQSAEAFAKAQVDKNPALDYNGMRQQYIDNIFYNTDKGGAKTFNEGFNPTLDFTAGAQPVYDQTKLKQLAQAEHTKNFAPIDLPTVMGTGANKLVGYSGKGSVFHKVDTVSNRTVWDTTPLALKGNDGRDYSVNVIANNDALRKVISSPYSGVVIGQAASQLRSRLPSSVSDEDVLRIAASQFVQENGPQPGAGLDEDRSAEASARQAAQDAINNGFRSRAEARETERLQMARDKITKADAEDAIDTNTILSQYDNNTLHTNKHGAHLAATQTIQVATPFGMMTALNINGVRGKTFLQDPNTKENVEVYAFKDPDTRQTGFAVIPYRQSTPTEMAKNNWPKFRKQAPVFYTGNAAKSFRVAIAGQLHPTKKEQGEFNAEKDAANE